MKICFITNLYNPFIFGGAEINVQRIAESLIQRGHNVVVITTSPNRKNYEEYLNGVKIYRVYPFNLYPMYSSPRVPMIIKPIYYAVDIWNPFSYLKVKSIIKNEMPDIVHINNFRGFSLSVFSAIKSMNLPLIFTVHDYSLLCIMGTLLRNNNSICYKPSLLCRVYVSLQRYIIQNKPDLVISPSEFVIGKMKEKGFFNQTSIKKVPLGIELSRCYKEKSYDTIDILYVGALSKHKGVHILINSFKKLTPTNLRLHIIGKGKDLNFLKEIANSDSRIIFHGFVNEDEIDRLYQLANIVVVPSIWYDNSPTVIYESLSHGTPVIGSNIGGIPELIEPGKNGFLFNPGDIDELTKIITNLILNPSQLQKMSLNSIESSQKYDLNNNIKILEEIYSSIRKGEILHD